MKENKHDVASPRPLNMTGDWDEQVNGRADRAEHDRNQQIIRNNQQIAIDKARKRANWILAGIMVGLALIVVGGCSLNYIRVIPAEVSISVAIIGVAAYMFSLGYVLGHRRRH